MQFDMHYSCTYTIAMAAGIKHDFAHIIANCSQFVDDCASKSKIKFQDAGQIYGQATAHHAANIMNLDKDDQRQVWVPFHFLPGNEGDDFTERLICRKDSSIAKEMMKETLDNLKTEHGIYRLGIATHVYADTFAHYGFSGIGSRHNKIENDSIKFVNNLEPEIKDYIEEKAKEFEKKYQKGITVFANIKSWLVETVSGALGHGAVATYPDRPYLVWNFDYSHPETHKSEERNNPDTYLEYCKSIHSFFSNAAQINNEIADQKPIPFKKIESAIRQILFFQGKKDDRVKKWETAAADGQFLNTFEIPKYSGFDWLESRCKLHMTKFSKQALTEPFYLFYKAASEHRQYILRDLLPRHGLIVA